MLLLQRDQRGMAMHENVVGIVGTLGGGFVEVSERDPLRLMHFNHWARRWVTITQSRVKAPSMSSGYHFREILKELQFDLAHFG